MSALQSLRLNGAVRGIVIAYGVALGTYFMARAQHRAPSGLTTLLVAGLAVQAALWLWRRLARGRPDESAPDDETSGAAIALYVFELIADGATVLLFAIATFRGMTTSMPEL